MMDFRQTRQTPTGPSQPVNVPNSPVSGNKANQTRLSDNHQMWFRLLNVAILIGVAILVVAIAFAFTRHRTPPPVTYSESKYVNSSKYQAVFLNNGQVYFGNIKNLNTKYVQLNNIYYLTQGSTPSGTAQTNGNYTLVKLGCQQIHDPYDQMLINRDQITFWENLQDNGKVVDSIKTFQKRNPNGPDCTQVSDQTQATNTAPTQGSSSTSTKQ